MDLKLLDRMSPAELRAYAEFLLWHYRVIDGFWFLFVQERFDQKAAEGINERVWHKAAELAARDFMKRFEIGKGLRGFVQALRYFPWTIIIGYDIEEQENEVIITVPRCAPQVARIAKGLPEFSCKVMHRGEFSHFARVIDERIRVECLFAPPDPHPENAFCKWRFTSVQEGVKT